MDNIAFELQNIGFENEDNPIDECESVKLINNLEINSQLNQDLNKLEMQNKNYIFVEKYKDLLEEDILSNRIEILKNFIEHINNLIESKDMLSNYIQQPFTEEENYLPIEPKYQKKFVSLFQHFSQQINNMNMNVESLKWIHSHTL
eukprot:TRINITY_DN6389_c0_g1_i2.p1 TRINITY_DN6389_c0_g1~~TRINITY_DN6389_c0_g1_i2.p1  ORF type:complete len:146 (-),score=28.28 TRINITY_DN6389_c0_g1_i2:150-587(-)